MVKRGEIYYYDNGAIDDGNIQSGARPVVIMSNDKANAFSPIITVVPLTAKFWKKRNLPTHVPIYRNRDNGLSRNSLALAEQVTSINKSDLGDYKGCVDEDTLLAIGHALDIQLGLAEN
ncbi:MAG: type II toxin-antitoxin system PemK/MazF family toxin [Lachnospiraceae bacterium]|nr:type II toxin-antitoxin system PemK/MazF family toxin [Lachnospiraceae bacterium]